MSWALCSCIIGQHWMIGKMGMFLKGFTEERVVVKVEVEDMA